MFEKNKIENIDNEKFLVDDSPVFKFINANGNDQLSKMSGFDLQDLIILMDEYYIQLRNSLGLEQDITFGLELEFENAMKDRITRKLSETFSNDNWRVKDDTTLCNGAEIVSPPLKYNETTWEDLDKVCSIVEPLASIGFNSGGHIHVGTQVLGDDKKSWLNFIKMWSIYENIIFRFVYGDFLTARPKILKYAKPIAKFFWQDYQHLKLYSPSLNHIIYRISHDRYQAVNFKNVLAGNYNKYCENNTIEFRCPNGSLNPAIWQNNVNFLVKFLIYSRSTSFDDDLVQNRYQLNLDRFMELKWYDEIYLEQALELCDMLFTNNLDKVYFLKQYLKSFQVLEKNCDYAKAPQLTKKRN